MQNNLASKVIKQAVSQARGTYFCLSCSSCANALSRWSEYCFKVFLSDSFSSTRLSNSGNVTLNLSGGGAGDDVAAPCWLLRWSELGPSARLGIGEEGLEDLLNEDLVGETASDCVPDLIVSSLGRSIWVRAPSGGMPCAAYDSEHIEEAGLHLINHLITVI